MTLPPLNPQQQQALDELFAAPPNPKSPQTGWLQTWFGISQADVQSGITMLAAQRGEFEQKALQWIEHRPLDAAFEFMAAASLAFYMVEKDTNPKIDSYIDAFYYIATCASVGYADVFPVTHTGRAIASLVMIVGPAMAAKALDRPA